MREYRKMLGLQLMQMRHDAGMSQQQVADACGITRQNVQKIESGKYNVSIDIVGRILAVMGARINIDEMPTEIEMVLVPSADDVDSIQPRREFYRNYSEALSAMSDCESDYADIYIDGIQVQEDGLTNRAYDLMLENCAELDTTVSDSYADVDFDDIPEDETDRFILQKSAEIIEGWVLTDKTNNVVCRFMEHKFNDTQKFTFLDGAPVKDYMKMARIAQEMGGFMVKNHYDIAM